MDSSAGLQCEANGSDETKHAKLFQSAANYGQSRSSTHDIMEASWSMLEPWILEVDISLTVIIFKRLKKHTPGIDAYENGEACKDDEENGHCTSNCVLIWRIIKV